VHSKWGKIMKNIKSRKKLKSNRMKNDKNRTTVRRPPEAECKMLRFEMLQQ